MTLITSQKPKDKFWAQVLKYASASVAISGAILGLPILFPVLIIPTTIAIVASWVGGIGTVASIVAKQAIDTDSQDVPPPSLN